MGFLPDLTNMTKSPNSIWQQALVTCDTRQRLNGLRSVVVWLTGLSGSVKSMLTHTVEEKLHTLGCRTFVLAGDSVRRGLCGDLGFSASARKENIRRIGETAKLFTEAGMITLTAFISPFQADRYRVRQLLASGGSVEVYCRGSLEICEGLDVKGMYRRARAGEIGGFDATLPPYDGPPDAEAAVETGFLSLETCDAHVIQHQQTFGVITCP